ncbi:MAG TPA: hypothetical protein VFE30_08700 [Anaeromyxobacteraceae bacterium]|jgi:hypothetical protein|nr:hypothetical protein [Anaeromyxobacteraceae bacterium]
MVRLRSLLVVVACAFCAQTAQAAEITRLAASPERNNLFDVDLQVRYEHAEKKARISRERTDASGAVVDATELSFEESSNRIVPRIALGLAGRIELHAELPYVLADEPKWSPNVAAGFTSSLPPGFPAAAQVFHDNQWGDLLAGAAVTILSERADDTLPTWVAGLDVTAPTARRYDPATGVGSSKDHPVAVGERIWGWDAWTAISKQTGPADPYLKVHVRLPSLSAQTFSNCERYPCPAAGQTQAPKVVGLTVGMELVPYEDRAEHQRVAVDLRLGADWHSSGRWYNELSDAAGRLLQTEEYLTLAGQAGFNLRASDYVELRGTVSYSVDSSHRLSDLSWDPGTASGAGFGGRFRVDDAHVLAFGATALVSF